MTASAFLVTLPLKGGMTLRNGMDSVICWAESATMAKDIASAALSGDLPATAWANATATALVVGTELEGWVFTVRATDNNSPYTLIEASYTGANGDDIDAVGAGLKAALIAAGVAGADYNSTSNLLTIAASGDSMGDWHILAYAYPPATATSTSLLGFDDNTKSVSGFFGTITAENVAATARTSTLVASLPALYGVAKVFR